MHAQLSVILDKCTEISLKYRRSVFFFSALSFCFDFSFQTAYRNKNKINLKQFEAETAKKLRTMKRLPLVVVTTCDARSQLWGLVPRPNG